MFSTRVIWIRLRSASLVLTIGFVASLVTLAQSPETTTPVPGSDVAKELPTDIFESQTPYDPAARKQEQRLRDKLFQLQRAAVSESDPRVRKLQQELLEAADHERTRPIEVAYIPDGRLYFTQVLRIPVYYVTDRLRTAEGLTDRIRSTELEYGVAIAHTHTNAGMRPDFLPNAMAVSEPTRIRNPKITPERQLSFKNFLSELDENKTAVTRDRKILLFVPGYANDFSDAVQTTALLAAKLQTPVIPIVYSWPSSGSFSAFGHDKEITIPSALLFEQFLDEFLKVAPADVTIVCHSMGSREVSAALASLARRNEKLPHLKNVIYVAAEIPRRNFAPMWRDMKSISGVNYEFYLSNGDWPLLLVSIFEPRLGLMSDDSFLPQSAINVDASRIDALLQSIGHSYLVQSPSLAPDIGAFIDGLTPKQRSLTFLKLKQQSYYGLQ